ncbi:MAG: hypothetical protein JSU79_07775, partial [Dehalococcoidales bacterium]
SELQDWLMQKVKQICSTKEGLEAFRLQKGILKKLPEEIVLLAIFGIQKFVDTDQVLLKPVIGSQNHDAIVTDFRTKPASKGYIEITQAHEGENDYFRRCELLKTGFVFSNAPVIKTGKGKNRKVSILPEATSVEEGVKNELNRIVEAAKKKACKEYPVNTSLIIFFDDMTLSNEKLDVLNYPKIDDFVNNDILTLDMRFSHLYLVGEAKEVFREYPIKR